MQSVAQQMNVLDLIGHAQSGNRISVAESLAVATRLSEVSGMSVYPRSIVPAGNQLYALARQDNIKHLLNFTTDDTPFTLAVDQQRDVEMDGHDVKLNVAPADSSTAAYLRQKLNWLNPVTFGLRKSAGCGDRLGLATPGHLRAIRECKNAIAPIVAQQSIREMTRTARTPQDVIDDAMWGAFEEGWQTGYGADADHLKTFDDINGCVNAGFTFYTFDPGAYVNNAIDVNTFDSLPWPELETSAKDTLQRHGARYDSATIKTALGKYGAAVAHVVRLYRHLSLKMNGKPFEVEVSVDETEQPTTQAEHYMIVAELRRLGVDWVSLAPRYVGRFEKGVDYIGDLSLFERDFIGHARIAREWGPYKLSIHSGSDKFSIYPIVSRHAGQYVHLKTAGTSYLEALRTVARCKPALFSSIYTLAHERYQEDRASYHVSADPNRAPRPDLHDVPDPQAVLDQFDAREMLHVCFGSILAAFGEDIKTVLKDNEEMHYADLQKHFHHHFESFCA